MEFCVLGPVRVVVDGEPVRIGGPRERKVLAALVLRAGRPVRSEFLIEAVWNSGPPATGRAQIHNSVAALRRAFGPAASQGVEIVGGDGGFVLRTGAASVDAQEFVREVERAHRLAGEADAHGAVDGLRKALSLWRGAALEGVESQVLLGDAHRLDEQRMAALEKRFELELELGRHRELTGELAAAVAEHPLREPLVRFLMSALYRSGRQADALAAFQRCRELLAEELGVDPGPELAALHERILRGDPALMDVSAQQRGPEPPADRPGPAAGAPEFVPRQLPRAAGHFVGRATELAELDGLLDRADGSRLAVITGSAGTGKTATAVHWAHWSAARFPGGCLYVNLQGFDPTGEPMSARQAVRGFLQALGVPGDRMPAPLADQIGLYRSLVAERRILVLLDNARDAQQVRPLLPGTPAAFAVVTSRDRLVGLVAVDGAYAVRLGTLAPHEARALLELRTGRARVAAHPEAVHELAELCARLPLALNIAAARAAEAPYQRLDEFVAQLRAVGNRLTALDAGDPAASVRAVFSWSIHRLSPRAARLFRALGMHPAPQFGTAVCAALVGGAETAVRKDLDELVGFHLVEQHAPNRYVCHDLLRAFAAELCRTQEGENASEGITLLILDHYLHTAVAGDRLLQPHRPALTFAPPCEGAAPAALADAGEANRWFEAEIPTLLACTSYATAAGLDRHAWQLPWAMTTYLDRTVRWHDLIEQLNTALGALERLRDVPGRIRTHIDLAQALSRMDAEEEVVRHCEAAIELAIPIRDVHELGRASLTLSRAFASAEDFVRMREHAAAALAAFQDVGVQLGAAAAMIALATALRELGEPEQALASSNQALEIVGDGKAPLYEADALEILGLVHRDLGDTDEAVRCLLRAGEILAELGERYWGAELLERLGEVYLSTGSLDKARQAWETALETFEELGHPKAEQIRNRLVGNRLEEL